MTVLDACANLSSCRCNKHQVQRIGVHARVQTKGSGRRGWAGGEMASVRGCGMREFECTPIELRAKSFLILGIAGGVEILSAGTR